MKIVTLKPRHDRPIRLRHPWVFSGAIASVSRDPALGETVLVTDAEGIPLGLGAWSPTSQISVRMWRFDDGAVDEAFFADRVAKALAVRAGMAERFADMGEKAGVFAGMRRVSPAMHGHALLNEISVQAQAMFSALDALERNTGMSPAAFTAAADGLKRQVEALKSRMDAPGVNSGMIQEDAGLREALLERGDLVPATEDVQREVVGEDGPRLLVLEAPLWQVLQRPRCPSCQPRWERPLTVLTWGEQA